LKKNIDFLKIYFFRKEKLFEEKCTICQAKPSSIIYLPCRHIIYCEECDKKMAEIRAVDGFLKCGICREVVKSKLCILK